MALIKVVSLFFGFLFIVNPFSIIYARNNIENVPFDVKQVIEKVTSQQKTNHTDHRLPKEEIRIEKLKICKESL